jgi:hypothetical protein
MTMIGLEEPETDMTNSDQQNDLNHQLDIVSLLDDRFRLREDPDRQSDLELTHIRLRERLRQSREEEEDDSSSTS